MSRRDFAKLSSEVEELFDQLENMLGESFKDKWEKSDEQFGAYISRRNEIVLEIASILQNNS